MRIGDTCLVHQSSNKRHTDDGLLGEKAHHGLDAGVFRSFLAHPLKVAVLTSPIASEPKNQACAKLGVALARAGKNTLLIDCDFRRPALHKFFELSNASGMRQVLARERDRSQKKPSLGNTFDLKAPFFRASHPQAFFGVPHQSSRELCLCLGKCFSDRGVL
jgi:hypothetical protein